MSHASKPSRILLVVAAPAEAGAAVARFAIDPPDPWKLVSLSDHLDLVQSGVGKSFAAGAVARFADPVRHRAVVSLGIAGALPVEPRLSLLSVVVGKTSRFADEGIETPSGFRTMSEAGFPPRPGIPGDFIDADPDLLDELSQRARLIEAIATVSTCSGTDELALEVTRRTGATAEAMEGAAAGFIAWRLGIPFAEVRVISNTTGNRPAQQWDIPGALGRLSEFVTRL